DNLSKLASGIAGTEISLVNLIGPNTQWTVSSFGIEIQQMPREDSVCQYTILGQEAFEVRDLSADYRFKDKFYVAEDPCLKYYFGIPLINSEGMALGALCVMDKKTKQLTDDQRYQLKLLAKEVVERLEEKKQLNQVQQQYDKLRLSHKKVAHDIRGPLGGILGLAEMIESDINGISNKEILEFLTLIKKSSKNLLELSDELMHQNTVSYPNGNADQDLTLQDLKRKLEGLYSVQAIQKQVGLSVQVHGENVNVPFQKSKILQIAGNLISNAIKFTPSLGTVKVTLEIIDYENQGILCLSVKDSGVGIKADQIELILNGKSESSDGTEGEQGYGFGLNLVKYLVDTLEGELLIDSSEGAGTHVKVHLPLGMHP
ncbi:MAG: GAF domain-containing sensor histidine kinase, partial [Cyclobacteriaceae bacterium]|nr:GAF domain-containing sensor histidine kinase [Cyclobacteriaceae bacterium]